MTGVIFYNNDDMPVLHGDTFLSALVGKKIPKLPVSIHTPGKMPIIGLCQKVVLVNDHTAYAWSGSLTQAIDLDSIIRNLSQNLAPNELIEKISRAVDKEFNDLSFIIIAKTSFHENHILYRGSEIVTLDRFGDIIFLGSGAGDFYGELGTLSFAIPDALRALDWSSKRDSDRHTRWRLAEGTLQCRFLNQIFKDNVTGGIVETLIIRSPSIEKVGTTLFVFYHVRLGKAQGTFPTTVIKRFYYDGLLCVSYFDTRYSRREKYVIPPPHRYGQKYTLPDHLFDIFDTIPRFVTCIYERSDGGHRYYLDSGEFFMKNFGFNSTIDLFYVSRAYHDDMMSRIRVTQLL